LADNGYVCDQLIQGSVVVAVFVAWLKFAARDAPQAAGAAGALPGQGAAVPLLQVILLILSILLLMADNGCWTRILRCVSVVAVFCGRMGRCCVQRVPSGEGCWCNLANAVLTHQKSKETKQQKRLLLVVRFLAKGLLCKGDFG
jgi:hypothetical protein